MECQLRLQSFVADKLLIMVITLKARFVPPKRDSAYVEFVLHPASEQKSGHEVSLLHDKRGLKASFFLIRTELARSQISEIM